MRSTQSQTIYILMEDIDQTMHSPFHPTGKSVLHEDEAVAWMAKSGVRSYVEVEVPGEIWYKVLEEFENGHRLLRIHEPSGEVGSWVSQRFVKENCEIVTENSETMLVKLKDGHG